MSGEDGREGERGLPTKGEQRSLVHTFCSTQTYGVSQCGASPHPDGRGRDGGNGNGGGVRRGREGMGLDCVALHNITEGGNEKEREGCNEDFVLLSFSREMGPLIGRRKQTDEEALPIVLM